MLFIILAILWYIVGYAGFVYWSSQDEDVDLTYALFGLLIAVVGPFSWLFGFIAFGGGDGIIVFKRRNKR